MSDINIIIMRDRGQSHSFHFSPTTFKIVISLVIIIPLLLALSIWFGLSSYSKYVAVLEETASLRQSIEHNKQTVTRLANLERFLQKYSPDMLGLLVPAEDVDAANLPVIDGDKGVLTGELAESLAGSKMSFDIIENGAKENNAAEKNSENNTSESQNAENENTAVSAQENVKTDIQEEEKTETAAETAQQTEAAQHTENIQNAETAAQESAVMQNVNSGFVEIENFHAKLSAQMIDMNYQLKNLGKQVQIEGRQKYYLSSQIDGKFAMQEISNASNTTFKIRNLKNVHSLISLEGMKVGERAQIVVDVIMGDKVVFRQFYPLARF